MSSAMAPAWRVDVRPVIVYPVVVTVGPAVEMYQQLARSDVGNSRDAYQHRIALVNGFQLHANFKAVRRMLQTQHKDVPIHGPHVPRVSGNVLVFINEVVLRMARLVPG